MKHKLTRANIVRSIIGVVFLALAIMYFVGAFMANKQGGDMCACQALMGPPRKCTFGANFNMTYSQKTKCLVK